MRIADARQRSLTQSEAQKEIGRLSDLLLQYQHEYYVLGQPSVPDLEYDRLFDRLVELETDFPELNRGDSPSARVGSDLTSELPEVEHTIPVLSLDKAYSHDDVLSWIGKATAQAGVPVSFVVEEKIDGVSIVLYYRRGILSRAVTRGNGYVGNDVTANVSTIGAVPLRLSEPLSLAVRGEIYLPVDRFELLNRELEVPYANPRNLAAGTLRRVKSSDVASIPLNMFAYEGFIDGVENHIDILRRMARLGFRLNHRLGYFRADGNEADSVPGLAGITVGDLDALGEYLARIYDEVKQRPLYIIKNLYGIDRRERRSDASP